MTSHSQILSGRMLWLDCLRLLAGVSIVGLHASSDINGQPFPAFDSVERTLPVLFRCIMYVARTELFIVISLFLLCLSLDQRERPYRTTLAEQARRLLVPYAFWTVFYAFYRLIKAHVFGYDAALWPDMARLSSWVDYFILGSVQYHMHFIPTLFGLILLYPLYQLAVRNPWLGLVVLLCLLVKREVDVWAWATIQDLPGFPYFVRATKILTYTGYGMVAGSFLGLAKQNLSGDSARDLRLSVLYCAGLLFTVKLVYSFKVIESGNWQYGYTPAYWADFLMPVLIFMACMMSAGLNWRNWLARLAPFSFGIYLIHPVFLDLLEIGFWGREMSPGAYVLLKFTSAVLSTSCAVWVLSRSRFFGWTVGFGPLPRFSLPKLQRSKEI